MKLCFLAPLLSSLKATCEDPPAKKVCAEPNSSSAACIKPGSPSSIRCLNPVSPSTLCDSCLKEINSHCSGIETGPGSNFQGLYQYFKAFNDNHNCFLLAAKGRHKGAIKVILESGQKPLFSVIYDLKFASEDEMLRFRDFLRAYFAAARYHCGNHIERALSLFTDVMQQIAAGNRAYTSSANSASSASNASSRAKGKRTKQKHAYYHGRYRDYIGIRRNGEEPMISFLTGVIKSVRGDIKADDISLQFYEFLLSKLSRLDSLTDELVVRALRPYAKTNRSPFRIVSFQPVCAFIGYQARNEAYKAVIENLMRKMLLDEERLETESIYGMLRAYKSCRSLPFSLFIDYTVLVHEHIAAGNGEEKPVFLDLHFRLVMQLLPPYFQGSLGRESLHCLEKFKANIPALSDEIDEAGLSCIRGKCDSADAAAHVVDLLRDCWKARDFGTIASLASKIGLNSEQAMNLLRAISARRLEINIKIHILCELIERDVLSADIRAHIAKSLNNDTDLIVIYSLALISHACRAKRAGQEATSGTLEMYLGLRAKHLLIFVYSDGHPSAEYCALHACDILLRYRCYFRDTHRDFQSFWVRYVFPIYPLCFLTSLWNSFNGILTVPRRGSIDYDELVEVKILAFQMIRLHCQANQDNGALDRPVYGLLESRLVLPDIYIYYFQSDPRCIAYLIARYFLYYSEARGKRLGFKIDDGYAVHNRAAVTEFLEIRAISLLKIVRGCSPTGEIQTVINIISEEVYRWKLIRIIEHDNVLRKLVENMICELATILLSRTHISSSTTPRALQVMQAFSSILGYRQ